MCLVNRKFVSVVYYRGYCVLCTAYCVQYIVYVNDAPVDTVVFDSVVL
jgi:hypothetical protein